jgi:hypothetical protein
MRAKAIAVLQPTVCVAVMETDSIKTSRIAYSTDVGPSSERAKTRILCTNWRIGSPTSRSAALTDPALEFDSDDRENRRH